MIKGNFMKQWLLIFAIITMAHAEDLPMRLATEMVQGPITIQCSYLDLSTWPAVFRFSPTQFRCLLSTKATDTAEFIVTFITRDAEGRVNTATNRTAVQNRWSLAVLPTKDAILLSVIVSEVKRPLRFDNSTE